MRKLLYALLCLPILMLSSCAEGEGLFGDNPNAKDAGSAFTLATIPTDGSQITSDRWIITDSGEPQASEFEGLKLALASAERGRKIELVFPNINAIADYSITPQYSIVGVWNDGAEDNETLRSISAPNATYLGVLCLSKFRMLTKVDLPSALIIDFGAFDHCSSLVEVSIPKASSLGQLAFNECKLLSKVHFPELTSVESNAFQSCESLISADLPKVTTAGRALFFGCVMLESVNMPCIESFSGSPFTLCLELKNLTVGDNFSYENGLLIDKTKNSVVFAHPVLVKGEVSLPGITHIADLAFAYCNYMTALSAPDAEIVDYAACILCQSLKSVSLDSATELYDMALNQCYELETANIPQATKLGAYCFGACRKLTEINLPKAEHIGFAAFISCFSITELSLPAANYIELSAFENTDTLTALTLATTSTSLVIEGDAMAYKVLRNVTLTTGAANGSTINGKIWSVIDEDDEIQEIGPFKSVTVI